MYNNTVGFPARFDGLRHDDGIREHMDAAVIAIGFGEPDEPDRDAVEAYLERIFFENMDIEDDVPAKAASERAQTLARRRAPGLLEEYEAIGGSPLGEHLVAHVDRLQAELERRGMAVRTHVGTQFYQPTIEQAVEETAAVHPSTVAILPMYPLCGPSTTVKAIGATAEAIDAYDDWDPSTIPIGGWHRHQLYNRLRAENLMTVLNERGVTLHDDDTELVFSAHGTPVSYLEAGSRYDRYVEEYCEAQAALLGVSSYTLGYQNHGSRGVEWTQPDLEDAIEMIDATRLVVEPISFIHEQSETLFELEVELADEAAELGKEVVRIPIPHDDERLAAVLADLVEPAVAGFNDEYYGFRPCQCSNTPGTRCLCAPLS